MDPIYNWVKLRPFEFLPTYNGVRHGDIKGSLCPSNKVFHDSTSDTYYCYGCNTIVVLMRNKRCALTCKSQLPIEPNRKRCDMSECLENEFANKQLSIYYRYATQAIFQKIIKSKLRVSILYMLYKINNGSHLTTISALLSLIMTSLALLFSW